MNFISVQENAVSLDLIAFMYTDQIKNNTALRLFQLFCWCGVLLGILNTIYPEMPSSVCSHCEGHAEIVKFLNIV